MRSARDLLPGLSAWVARSWRARRRSSTPRMWKRTFSARNPLAMLRRGGLGLIEIAAVAGVVGDLDGAEPAEGSGGRGWRSRR